ncbi:CTD nuclear envelope phosphatase 1 homolog [Trifolium pratense]|uniref:CTD nuclear envelope phosphatase 1 homolog n=1 Tax=Trifolium pratense TaxID=57577 RepID=UPI001E6915F3|nr:CTD nuclear envelope phosphatase 1 homolog [Trifolium pratense]
MMTELTQMTPTEISSSPVTHQAWNALLSWLDFFYQIFSQIIGSFANYPLLSFCSHASFNSLPIIDNHSSLQISDDDNNDSDDHQKKLTVVLDLDETLICAYETSSLPDALKTQAIEAGLNWFELECVFPNMEADGKPIINHVTVFERPGLKEFLRQLSEFADLVLFTAGLEGYARPLVDRIDPENLFSLRLYRPSTVSTGYREHVKDLISISEDLCHIVIVDNNPYSFLLQPHNGIPCVPFSAVQPNDTQLLDVILPLLKQLSDQKDVRHLLYEKFHMPEWFQQNGIPVPN